MQAKTYIALTALQSHWGEPENTIMLGEWCRSCHENENYLHYSDKVISCRWQDPDDLDRAFRHCLDAAHDIAPALTEYLRRELNVDLDSAALKRIFWSWLLPFVSIVYDRYKAIEDAVAYSPGVCFITAPPEAAVMPAEWPAKGLWPLAHGEFADANNLILFSRIISFLGLQQKVVPLQQADFPSVVQWTRRNTGIKEKIRQSLAYAKRKFLYKNAFYLFFSMYMDFTPQYSSWLIDELTPPKQRIVINQELRNKSLDYGTCDFTRLLAKLIPVYIPWGFCEGLPGLVAWAKKHPARFAKAFVTALGTYVNVPLTVLASVAKRPLVVMSQDGRAMMFLRTHPLPVTDAFSSSDESAVKRLRRELPSPHLSRKLPEVSERLPPVLVCNEIYRYCNRFLSGQMPTQARNYHQARIDFLRAVPAALAPVVRLYFKEFGWGVRATLQKEFPDLRFQDPYEIAMDHILAATSLVICDHPISTFHFAIAKNIPTIFFSAPDIYDYNDEGRHIMEVMEQANICHRTPESAAQHYCSIYEDVEAWWNSHDVQYAINIYKEHYVIMSDDWQRDWNLLLGGAFL